MKRTTLKPNLQFDGKYVYSYDTKVAKVAGDRLIELGKFSNTTSKHVKYVAQQFGLDLVESSDKSKLIKPKQKSKSELEKILNVLGIKL